MNFSLVTLLFAFGAGIIPAIIWLFFWLSEDEDTPEPGRVIFFCFIGGMVGTFLALGFEMFIDNLFVKESLETTLRFSFPVGLTVIILASFIEEIAKYGGAYFAGIKSKTNDEPTDPMIYLITAALGFAAMENSIFLITEFVHEGTIGAIQTANLRFLGSTLLHVASSAIIGMMIAFSMFKREIVKKEAVVLGLILATSLHAIYNLSIIVFEEHIRYIFAILWILIIIILAIFEKIKNIHLNTIRINK